MEILIRFFGVRYTSEQVQPILDRVERLFGFGLVLSPSLLLFRFLSQLSQTSQKFFFALTLLGGLFQ